MSSLELKLSKAEDIYENLEKLINQLIEGLNYHSGNSRIVEAEKLAQNELATLKEKVGKNLAELGENAEWEKFTIAFYGETNAGKSTLIETLRIMLNEKTKCQEQEQFFRIQKEFDLTEERENELHELIKKQNVKLKEHEEEFAAYQTILQDRKEEIAEKQEELALKIAQSRAEFDFWQKLIYWFKKLPAEKEAKELEHTRLELIREATKKQKKIDQEKEEICSELEKCEIVKRDFEKKMEQLLPFVDGTIIGDGRSDFTTQSKSYDIEIGNAILTLLDLPGIEGKESDVQDQILQAVQKAHVVFYVTGKPMPPQVGNSKQKGTLEKIKENLGNQTEVWTIYNKRAINPSLFERDSLFQDEDEKISLQELDRMMREQLGMNYRETISLSAYGAFMSVGSCLLPSTRPLLEESLQSILEPLIQQKKRQKKFLSKISSHELRDKSRLEKLRTFLTGGLIENYEVKIKRANYAKVNYLVSEANERILERAKTFATMEKELGKTSQETKNLVARELSNFVSQVEDSIETHQQRFQQDVREELYSWVDYGIDDDDLKERLSDTIVAESKKMESRVSQEIKQTSEEFRQNLTKQMAAYEEDVEGMIANFESLGKLDFENEFNFKVNLGRGMNLEHLFGLAGLGIAAFFGAGLVVLALGAVGIVVNFLKSLFTNKKSRQRKAIDENLSKVCRRLKESLEKPKGEIVTKIEQVENELIVAIDSPHEYMKRVRTLLEESHQKMTHLSNVVKSEGGLG